jgi:hypothetical protein
LRIFTWPVHGNYMWYLSLTGHDFFVPVARNGRPGYGGRGETFPYPETVHDVPVEDVRDLDIDCVMFQSHAHWLEDQYEVLSDAQRRLPRIFVEHDPPRERPTDTRHPVDDPDVLLVHVTHFNRLMWDSGRTPTAVVEHGVAVPDDVQYTGELERGIVVVNCLARRGRRLGTDVFEQARRAVPLDLVGMESGALGGVGEVAPTEMARFESRYRFFFNPIRYTSLGLAVCEAMMIGMPIIGLATTEMVTAVENGVSGYVDTNVDALVAAMRELLASPEKARRLGEGARAYARERFSIDRFCRDWNTVLSDTVGARQGASFSLSS